MSNEIVKNLNFGDEARNNVFNGIDKLYKAVSSTLGAGGKCVLMEGPGGEPVVTKDGVTIADAITLLDPVENMGAKLLKQAARKTVQEAGDGTTTATVLAHSIITNAKEVTGFSEREIKAGINSATAKVMNYLDGVSTSVVGDTLKNIATVSSNNDEELGEIISSAFNEVGKDGVVTIEISRDDKTGYEVITGARIDQPLTNDHFINDIERGACVLDNPLVLVVENKIKEIKDIETVLAHVIKNNRSLLIVGDAELQVTNVLAMNNLKHGLNVNIIAAPDYGVNRKEKMADIAMLTGATVINENLGDDMDLIQVEHLGECVKATTNKENTILDVGDLNDNVLDLIKMVNKQMKETKLPGKRIQLEKRLSLISCKVAIITVGANSDVELKEKSDRVEDAVCATKAAVSGIVPGGGVALLNAAQSTMPSNECEMALLKAIKAPYDIIMTNGEHSEIIYDERDGYGVDVRSGEVVNMIEAGIIDPLMVTKSALKNAVSVATTIMSTDCVINNVRIV